MIDALTVNFVLIILSIIYFIMAYAIYIARKEKYLFYYSLTFITLAIAYILLFFQKFTPDWISFLLMNMLILLSQVFVIAGIRLLYKQKAFVKRYYVYYAIFFILMCYFTFIHSSINARIIVLSTTVIIYHFDLLSFIKRHRTNVIPSVHKGVSIITWFSVINWVSRIVFALMKRPEAKYLVDQGTTTAAYYIIALVTISVWFALYILLETTQSVYHLKQINEELSELALVDNLTNLANRHYFDHDLDFLTGISKRNGSKMSMLMIDLDRFKLVNDTFGHLVGDDVLIHTAQLLKDSVRTTDRVYRWGGEEFIIITPETCSSQASVVAEKICQKFRDEEFDVIGKITVSIGIASYDSSESNDDWIKRADLALYQAKQTGRNKWVAWLDDEALPSHFTRFVWSTEYESGNSEIDNDHKLLAEYVNQLHDLIIDHYPIDTIHEFIYKMNKHIQQHFTREEAILIKHRYSDYMEHRAIHHRILSEYEIIVKKAINGDISLGALMSYLVEKVLIYHISEDDKKFFSVVK